MIAIDESDNGGWRSLPADLLGGVGADPDDAVGANDILTSLDASGAGQSFLAWHQYRLAVMLHAQLVEPFEEPERGVVHADRIIDAFVDAAARIAISQATSQTAAERLLNEAVALRDRLPRVAATLRDGLLRPWQVQVIISRTDLVDGRDCAGEVDAEIAALVRRRRGKWSRRQVRDMVDRIVFRHDPDAVRERRDVAVGDRRMWTANRDDGTAEIGATMAAENVRLAAEAVTALAAAVCGDDPRRKPARASDAMFALLTGTPFECQCGRDDCPAQIPAPGTIPPVSTSIVLHVVCDESTLAGAADHPGHLDGHGVISADHIRDIAARTDTTVSPLVSRSSTGPAPAVPAEPSVATSDSTTALTPTPAAPPVPLLRPSLPSDPYRPSTALATFLHIRDGYCVVPGCDQPAWSCDLDHVHEYDHDDPAAGGRTCPDDMNDKCRFHHIHKTHSEWLDDQYRDGDGGLHAVFITPEGFVIDHTINDGTDLFPGLRRIRFATPAPAPPRIIRDAGTDPDPDPPLRRRTRLANKLARRRAERARNRRQRENDAAAGQAACDAAGFTDPDF